MVLRQALVNVCFLSCFVAACDATPEDAGSTKSPATEPEKEVTSVAPESFEAMKKPETIAERREMRQRIAASGARNTQGMDRAPAGDTNAVLGEVPDEILGKIVDDLASKIGAERAEIEVLHAESLTWSDGSLGCGKPGDMYTQALVPGYRVILGKGGQVFDYRATEHGLFVLCEQPSLVPSGRSNEPPVQ